MENSCLSLADIFFIYSCSFCYLKHNMHIVSLHFCLMLLEMAPRRKGGDGSLTELQTEVEEIQATTQLLTDKVRQLDDQVTTRLPTKFQKYGLQFSSCQFVSCGLLNFFGEDVRTDQL